MQETLHLLFEAPSESDLFTRDCPDSWRSTASMACSILLLRESAELIDDAVLVVACSSRIVAAIKTIRINGRMAAANTNIQAIEQ
jgi:hypothetical protein